MRCTRTAGAACLVMMGMLLLVGGAGASVLTSPAGSFVEAGTKIKAEGAVGLDGTVDVNCSSSTLEAEAGTSGTTVSAPVKSLAFTGCGNDTVSVIKPGSLELHATGEGNGTLTSSGAEITVQVHRSVFGFAVTTHCIYKTSNTDLGTFTGSATTKATAKLDLIGTNLPQEATDGSCGNSAPLTGSYTFTSPDYLDVDQL